MYMFMYSVPHILTQLIVEEVTGVFIVELGPPSKHNYLIFHYCGNMAVSLWCILTLCMCTDLCSKFLWFSVNIVTTVAVYT